MTSDLQLLAGFCVYGSIDGHFVTRRDARSARVFWSLLEERKLHAIETRAPTRLQRLPTFAVTIAGTAARDAPKPVRKCDRLVEVRAAFLACGSLAAGARGYHLEFVVRDEGVAARLTWMLRSNGVAAKETHRKGRAVLYLKDFDAIAELLTRIGAFAAVLRLEDVRALRETKNRIHRLVNTEAANLQRSAQPVPNSGASSSFCRAPTVCRGFRRRCAKSPSFACVIPTSRLRSWVAAAIRPSANRP